MVLRWSFERSPLGMARVVTEPPFGNVGEFLSEAAYRADSWVFRDLLPDLERLSRGELSAVTPATSEEMYLLAAPGVVTIGWLEPDMEASSPPCTAPLGEFIEVARRWRDHLSALGGHARGR